MHALMIGRLIYNSTISKSVLSFGACKRLNINDRVDVTA